MLAVSGLAGGRSAAVAYKLERQGTVIASRPERLVRRDGSMMKKVICLQLRSNVTSISFAEH